MPMKYEAIDTGEYLMIAQRRAERVSVLVTAALKADTMTTRNVMLQDAKEEIERLRALADFIIQRP